MGLAEASVFFIVPDVWLTIICRHRLDKVKYQAVGFAILVNFHSGPGDTFYHRCGFNRIDLDFRLEKD